MSRDHHCTCMVDHVLVPVDASEKSDAAFQWVLDEFEDLRVTVLHVVHPKDTSHEEGAVVDHTKVLMGKPSDVLARYDVDRGDVDLERKLAVSNTEASAIVDCVEALDCDLVALGSHGREGVSRILLGSVAEKVARRSPSPVLVVR